MLCKRRFSRISFLGFSSSGGVAEGRGGFFCGTELHGVGHRVAQCLYLRVFARNRIICESVAEFKAEKNRLKKIENLFKILDYYYL